MSAPSDRALAAREAAAADDHRGDDVQLEAVGAGGIADGQAGELHQAGDAGEEAAQDVDRQLDPGDRDAAEARGLLVRADGEDVAAEARVEQQAPTAKASRNSSQTPGGKSIQSRAAGRRARSSLSQEAGASIFWSWARPLATPRTTSIVPSVTMKGTTRRRVTSRPLSAPQATPAAMPRQRGEHGRRAGAQEARR